METFSQQPNLTLDPTEAFCIAVQQVVFWPCVAVLAVVAAWYTAKLAGHLWRNLARLWRNLAR